MLLTCQFNSWIIEKSHVNSWQVGVFSSELLTPHTSWFYLLFYVFSQRAWNLEFPKCCSGAQQCCQCGQNGYLSFAVIFIQSVFVQICYGLPILFTRCKSQPYFFFPLLPLYMNPLCCLISSCRRLIRKWMKSIIACFSQSTRFWVLTCVSKEWTQ